MRKGRVEGLLIVCMTTNKISIRNPDRNTQAVISKRGGFGEYMIYFLMSK